MKKLLLVLILIALSFSCGTKKLIDFGFISFYYGDVTIVNDGKKTKPKLKMILISGDTIQTRAKGRVDVQLHNFGVIRINQNSKVDINKVISEVNESIKIGLDKGQILCKFKKLKKGKEAIIETPTAVAGVRGTTFLVEADEKTKKSEIAVTSGSVEVANKKDPGKKKTVNANETAEVSTKDKVLKVVKGIDTKKLKELKVLEKVKIFKDVKSVNVKSLKKLSVKNLKALNIKDMKGLGSEFKSFFKGSSKGESGASTKANKKVEETKAKVADQKAKIEEKKTELELKKAALEEQKKKAQEQADKAKKKLKKLFK